MREENLLHDSDHFNVRHKDLDRTFPPMIQVVLSFVSGVGEWLLGLLIGDYVL